MKPEVEPSRPRALAVGALRHRVETALWRTNRGARWLLERDLRELDVARRRPNPSPLASFEDRTFSQNGEDGIIERIVGELGIERGAFAEIAAADGSENCTRALAEKGWSGVWVEGDPELSARSKELPVAAHLEVVCAFVTADNVCELLNAAGVAPDVDVFVLDIDGADHSILASVLGSFRPKVIVHEYNGAHRYPWVMSPHRSPKWERDWNFGASLSAYELLLVPHGYDLVGCDSMGVNAFWVRRDLRPASMRAASASEYFVIPLHRPGATGHPRITPLTGSAAEPGDAVALTSVAIRHTRLIGSTLRDPGETVSVVGDFENRSTHTLSSEGDHPVLVAYQLLDEFRQSISDTEPQRAPMSSLLRPGDVRPLAVDVPLPVEPGEYRIAMRLVQERVAWGAADVEHSVAVTVRRGRLDDPAV